MRQTAGFTLVELIITLAITGIIFSVAGGLIYQLNTTADYGNDQLTLWHEMQNLSNRFYLDGAAAVSASGGDSLELQLSSGQSVTYSLSGTDLARTENGSITLLAANISFLNFAVQDRLITLNITSLPPGRMEDSEAATYKVYMRSISQ